MQNLGTSSVHIDDILTSGIDFSETNTCGSVLPAAAQCAIAVTFKPATIGPREGTISILSSGLGSPQLIALSGTGE
jgi:hypothetical protein